MPRLRRSRTDKPGVTRVPRGRGASYIEANGTPLRDPAAIERIRALGIPPAWTDVWIAPAANDHIQATGLDAAGRRQYIYHAAWRATKDREKFDRMLDLADALPAARRGVTHDLRQPLLDQSRVLAGAFRLLDATGMRSGSEEYERENGSYGLSTLLAEHVTVSSGDMVTVTFPGKSGKTWESQIRDAELAPLMTQLKRRGSGARLLAWKDSSRTWHPLRSDDINADVRARTHGNFTAKDFRTLRGSTVAAASLAREGPAPSARARQRAVAAAYVEAADALGNTPAVARKSYVDPRIIDRYQRGETVQLGHGRSIELALRALLIT